MGEQTAASGGPAPDRLGAAVTGHFGVGRDTTAAALTGWFGISATASDAAQCADLVVHVLGAGVRECDRRFLARWGDAVVVVAGKADLRGVDPGGWQRAAAALAARAADDLERPVYPVSGLLARAEVTAELLADLDRWLSAGVGVPPVALAFAEVDDDAERRRRAAALVSLGAAGLRAALALRAGQPGCDAAALTGALRAASGFRALIEPIRACGPAIAAARLRRHRRELTVQAAGCPAQRDELERRALVGVPVRGPAR